MHRDNFVLPLNQIKRKKNNDYQYELKSYRYDNYYNNMSESNQPVSVSASMSASKSASINLPYIKVTNDKLINQNAITWIRRIEECMHICTRTDGCDVEKTSHKICKYDNPTGYNRVNTLFSSF